jgi:hypothetical protein
VIIREYPPEAVERFAKIIVAIKETDRFHRKGGWIGPFATFSPAVKGHDAPIIL